MISNLRHFLSIDQFNKDSLVFFFEQIKKNKAKGFSYASPILKNQVVTLIFLEPSTRTRVSFEIAAQKLGANVVVIQKEGTSLQKGETILDTFSTIQAMGCKYFVLRSPDSEIQNISTYFGEKIGLVNAGDGSNEHPTQALIDGFTMWEHFPDLEKRKIAIIGDVARSRVAKSVTKLLNTFGNKPYVYGPKELTEKVSRDHVHLTQTMHDAIGLADVVMMLRVQNERTEITYEYNEKEYLQNFGLTAQRLKLANPKAIVMHPGPFRRDIEIESALIDSHQSVIFQQVHNGVWIRMALFELINRGLSLSLLLKNAHVIDPSQSLDRLQHVLISNGKIENFFEENSQPPLADEVIDLAGKYLAPGFVDLHVHFREPGQAHKEDIESGSKAAVAGGFTSVLCMPNTYPTNDSVEVTKQIVDRAKEVDLCRVYPVGAVTKNLMSGDLAPLYDLRKAGCIAFSDDGRPVSNTTLLREALIQIREMDCLMIEHCEEVSMARYVTIHDGEVSKEMGLRGIPIAAETADVVRLIALAAETNAKVHLAHLSCEDSVKFLQMFRQRLTLTAEVTPHHLVLTHEDIRVLGTNGKMYPPLRRKQDCEALIQALNDDVIDAIATDHAPHSIEEKSLAFEKAPNGVIGLETALPVMLRLYHEKRITLNKVVETMSLKPAKIVGLELDFG